MKCFKSVFLCLLLLTGCVSSRLENTWNELTLKVMQLNQEEITMEQFKEWCWFTFASRKLPRGEFHTFYTGIPKELFNEKEQTLSILARNHQWREMLIAEWNKYGYYDSEPLITSTWNDYFMRIFTDAQEKRCILLSVLSEIYPYGNDMPLPEDSNEWCDVDPVVDIWKSFVFIFGDQVLFIPLTIPDFIDPFIFHY